MKMHLDRTLHGVLILGAAITLVPAAQAAGPVWTHVAGACVIDKQSEANATVQESELKFDAGRVGEIVARCNVVNPIDDGQGPLWRYLEVVYRGADGPLPANQVRVQLKRVTNLGVPFLVATFNGLPGGPRMDSVPFVHAFNFFGNAYWVEIRIRRSGLPTSQNPNNPSVFLVRLR